MNTFYFTKIILFLLRCATPERENPKPIRRWLGCRCRPAECITSVLTQLWRHRGNLSKNDSLPRKKNFQLKRTEPKHVCSFHPTVPAPEKLRLFIFFGRSQEWNERVLTKWIGVRTGSTSKRLWYFLEMICSLSFFEIHPEMRRFICAAP